MLCYVRRSQNAEATVHQVQQAPRGGVARQSQPDAHEQRMTALAAATTAAADARTRKRKEREQQEQLDALAFAASEDEEDPGYDHDDQKRMHEAAAKAWLQDSAAQDAACEAEQPRRERERDRAEREKQDDLAHASEPIWVQDSESGTWNLYSRGEIAGERGCGFFCYLL